MPQFPRTIRRVVGLIHRLDRGCTSKGHVHEVSIPRDRDSSLEDAVQPDREAEIDHSRDTESEGGLLGLLVAYLVAHARFNRY